MGGLSGADSICAGLATGANLHGTYKAFLSDGSTDAAGRLTHSIGPYALVDGTIVANNWTDLTSGGLMAAIDEDETGGPALAPATATTVCGDVYTGGFPDGSRAGSTCNSWTSNSSSDSGVSGNSSSTGFSWTFVCPSSCDGAGALYCLQQ
jgi:hypothetical protein